MPLAWCYVPVLLLLQWASAGSVVDDGASTEPMTSCLSSSTVTTTIGISLVQAASLHRRVQGGLVKDYSIEQARRKTNVRLDAAAELHKLGLSDTVELATAREGATYVAAIHASVGILHRGAKHLSDSIFAIVHDAVGHANETSVTGYPTTQAAKRSAGMLVFLVLVMLILCAIYIWLSRQEKEIAGPLKSVSTFSVNTRSVERERRSPGLGNARQLLTVTGSRAGSMLAPPNLAGARSANSSDDEEQARASGFCPDLIVPDQCECILVVPVQAPPGNFNISDMNGRAVLHAFAQADGPGAPWQVRLQTAAGEALAHCGEVRASTPYGSEGMEFHILDGKADYFATLKQIQGQQRFQLTTKDNHRLQFWGNFQTQAVNVTDEKGGLLATTEVMDFENQTGIYYRLRVAPLANVGQSLCGLLCIGQILKAEAAEFRSPRPVNR